MCPTCMLGLYDYPETEKHPAFNLALRVNFVNGAGETSGIPLRRRAKACLTWATA